MGITCIVSLLRCLVTLWPSPSLVPLPPVVTSSSKQNKRQNIQKGRTCSRLADLASAATSPVLGGGGWVGGGAARVQGSVRQGQLPAPGCCALSRISAEGHKGSQTRAWIPSSPVPKSRPQAWKEGWELTTPSHKTPLY